MRNSKQKLKLLYLIQIFDEYTDEEHGITMSEIIKKLDDNGIKAERKSIYDDIEQLGTVGYEIVTEKLNRETVYKTVTRKFDVSELKMLVDVVQASKFISKKDSEAQPIDRLAGLDKVLENDRLYRSGKLGTGGYFVTFNDSIDVPTDILYESGEKVPLGLEDFKTFVRHNIIDTTESCEMLECSRQNISYMVNQEQMSAVKEDVRGNLYLKGEVLSNRW